MGANKRTLRCLRVRKAAFREAFGHTTDYAIAVRLGIHPSTMSLLMNRNLQPSNRLIVKALDESGRRFEDLFEIVDEVAA